MQICECSGSSTYQAPTSTTTRLSLPSPQKHHRTKMKGPLEMIVRSKNRCESVEEWKCQLQELVRGMSFCSCCRRAQFKLVATFLPNTLCYCTLGGALDRTSQDLHVVGGAPDDVRGISKCPFLPLAWPMHAWTRALKSSVRDTDVLLRSRDLWSLARAHTCRSMCRMHGCPLSLNWSLRKLIENKNSLTTV